MKLFLLDRTPLDALKKLILEPAAGDVVVYFRPGQDPEEIESEKLKQKGIECLWGELLLDREVSLETDRLGGKFIDSWYRVEDQDISAAGDLSFGKLLDWEIGRLSSPKFVIRTGEIIRRAIRNFPGAEQVYSDFTDGESMDRVKPQYRPTGRLAKMVVASLDKQITSMQSADPLPPLIVREYEISWARMFRTFIGGYRPKWLIARIKRKVKNMRPSGKKSFYIFVGRGTEHIVDALQKHGNLDVVTNRIDLPGVASLRHDHLLALPEWGYVKTVWRLKKYLSEMRNSWRLNDPYVFNGISYGPILADAVKAVIENLLWKNIFFLAQTKKLIKQLNCDGYLVNADAGFLMGALIDLQRDKKKFIYYVGHGMNLHRYGTLGMGHNNPHVTYIAHGTDHEAEFGVQLKSDEKPFTPVVGNPLTVLMNPICGRRPKTHGKRILILGTGYAGDMTATRSRSCERHLSDVYLVVRDLAGSGWSATYRGHPHHAFLLEKELARRCGVDDIVSWDESADLSDALLCHDVAISAFSSTFYQCLYAGWPTIYYDPSYLGEPNLNQMFTRELFCGLLTADDLWRPIAVDRKELKNLITNTLNQNSDINRFATDFSNNYANRFIGPRANDADQAIADLIDGQVCSRLNKYKDRISGNRRPIV